MNPLDSTAIKEEEENYTVVEDGTCILEDIIKVENETVSDEENITEDTFLSENLFDNELITKTFEDEVFVNEVTIEESN